MGGGARLLLKWCRMSKGNYRRTYTFHHIDVGDHVVVEAKDFAADKRVRRAVSVYNTRTDKHFSCRRDGDNLKIVRNR